MIETVAREVVPGEKYTGKITKVEDFGCFVELWPGTEGLVHVSQLAWERVNKPSDMFKVGDEIVVIAEGYDNKNRLNLSRKAALPKPEKKEEKEEKKEAPKKENKKEEKPVKKVEEKKTVKKTTTTKKAEPKKEDTKKEEPKKGLKAALAKLVGKGK